MALECAHCGNRCDDGATRCPKCLRTSHLVPVSTATARRRRGVVVGAVLTVLALGVGVARFVRGRAPTTPALPSVVPAVANDPLAVGDELAPLVALAHSEHDPVSRARRVAAEVHRRRAASVVSDDEPTPPPRAPALLWRVLPVSHERVTEFDLARLLAAVLRAAGDPATIAERTAPVRSDDVIDPTGARGSFVVLVGEHVIEPALGTLVGREAVRHRVLDDRALAGAIAAQAALELVDSGAVSSRAIEYANAAVEAWPDAPQPLVVRARVWLAVGASGGLGNAESDLRAALAMREDAALFLALARVALLRGDLVAAFHATQRAARLAPAWGSASAALFALRDVAAHFDAGTLDGCARLRDARAPWTDDAYALCASDVAPELRAEAARRLLDTSHDPLRVALAATALPTVTRSALAARVARHEHRELAAWLLLLGRADLFTTDDAGAP